MGEVNSHIVLGPDSSSTNNMKNSINPLTFITNSPNKVQYRDVLNIWTDIIQSFGKADAKYKARLEIMGLIVYLPCDHEAKAKLRAEETEERLTLKGNVGDPECPELFSEITETLAQERSSEKIHRDVNLLNEIQQCRCIVQETKESYANKFEAKVPKYVH